MIAKNKRCGEWQLFSEGHSVTPFGELCLGVTRWNFTSNDETLQEAVRYVLARDGLTAATPIREVLGTIRTVAERVWKDYADEAEAEHQAEMAIERFYETPTLQMMAEDDYERELEANDPWFAMLRAGRDETIH